MIVSTDMPEELIAKIDALICEPTPPEWPFKSRTVILQNLTPEEHKMLSAYNADHAAYEAAQRNGTTPRTRAAVLRMIVVYYFEHNPAPPTTASSPPVVATSPTSPDARQEALTNVRNWARDHRATEDSENNV